MGCGGVDGKEWDVGVWREMSGVWGCGRKRVWCGGVDGKECMWVCGGK